MTDFHDLLEKTSRTFALSIPLLEEPTRRYVTNAYLLFRIADTFEDAAVWSKQERIVALERFTALLRQDGDIEAAARDWVARRPTDHAGYLELLAETPAVLSELQGFPPEIRDIVCHHTLRTAEGMARIVERTDAAGELRLRDLDELRDYCYVVAGIVGELLTDLFLVAEAALLPVATELRERAATFGEALQLVNILKDAADDGEQGRRFLPAGLERAEIFELARHDLRVAQEYTELLSVGGGALGTVAFTTLPVRLAWATLDEVERRGPGAKVGREEVLRILDEVHRNRRSRMTREG